MFDTLFIQPDVELVNVNSRLGLGCLGAAVPIGHFNIRWLHVDRLQLYFGDARPLFGFIVFVEMEYLVSLTFKRYLISSFKASIEL